MSAPNTLGIIAKSVESLTGQGFEGAPSSESLKQAKRHAESYDWLRVSQSLLFDKSKHFSAQHRTCWCRRTSRDPNGAVDVLRAADGSKSRYEGVSTCGSVWACPVCSYSICSQRGAELSEGSVTAVKQGWHQFLLTFTFPHQRDVMGLKDMRDGLAKAMKHFQSSGVYKRILPKHKPENGGQGVRLGTVKATELTWGETNGWHPHCHVILFARPDAFGETTEKAQRLSSRLITELKGQWFESVKRAGLCEQSQMNDVLEHGLDVRGGQYAAEYIAKFGKEQRWGLSREATMHACKMGSDRKGAHPFQFLAWAQDGDGQAADLFREYAEAMQGVRMLTYSPGLKAVLGMDEVEDEELADQAAPEEQRIGTISGKDFSALIARNKLGWVIGMVSMTCFVTETRQDDLNEIVKQALTDKRTGSGTVRTPMYGSREYQYSDLEKEAA